MNLGKMLTIWKNSFILGLIRESDNISSERSYHMLLEDKDIYTIEELFDALPIPIAELARQSGMNEVTLARIRDGKATRLSTRNKLLIAFSRIYGRNFTKRDVTGIHLQGQVQQEERAA